MSAPQRAGRVGLSVVLVATLCMLFFGFAHKSLCLLGDFNERRYTAFCYSDIVPLYRSEGLSERRFPYLDAPNEYPPGTALVMWSAALVSRGEGQFFLANAALLAALALLTSWLLYRAVGSRALYFALAPTLALYAFLNWDLLAVALATAGTVAFLRRRDVGAGILLGLGAAAKVFPALLLVPFALQRVREGDRRSAIRMAAAAAGAWALLNLPFVTLAFQRWSYFLRFNSERAPSPGTLWYAGCQAAAGAPGCGHVRFLDVLSLLAFVAIAVLVWRRKRARWPGFPAWTFGLPLLAALLLTTKVYSPQYSLWLLPWFALVLPDLRLFLLFEAADAAVFVTEFSNLARLSGQGGAAPWLLTAAVLARATVLVGLLAAYVQTPEPAVESTPSDRVKMNPSPSW
jgi:uncharacterized membrane protein